MEAEEDEAEEEVDLNVLIAREWVILKALATRYTDFLENMRLFLRTKHQR